MNDPLKPPKIIEQMQLEAETCSEQRLSEIVKRHRNYYNFIINYPDSDWCSQAEEWLDALKEIAKNRFGHDLTGFNQKADNFSKDAYLIKYKMTDSTRSIYFGIKTKEPITKFEAELWKRLSAKPPIQGQWLITYNNLKQKVLDK